MMVAYFHIDVDNGNQCNRISPCKTIPHLFHWDVKSYLHWL